jgi:tRNA(His) 5'-end guanylyltransferase
MMDKEGVPSSSGIDIIDGETESDETPPVLKENAVIYTRKISQLVNKMCSQQTWFTSKSNKTLIFLFFECNCAKY